MMRIIVTSIVLFLSSQFIFAQDNSAALKQMQKDVEYLSSDKLKGREAGTKYEKKAADYLAKRFKEIGLTTLGDDETYIQSFSFPKSKDPHTGTESKEQLKGVNVVGMISNGANTNVVIGAHFDHLGMGGANSNSLATEEGIHNGADDNASGVAVILRLAEALKKGDFKRNNFIIIAFTGEEKGLYGSNYFLKNPPFYLNTMNYMLNYDMVGRLDSAKGFVINGVGTSPIWKSSIEKANTEKIHINTTESGVGPSDHTSFYLKDIPAVHLFTGSHSDYHKLSDDHDKINYEGMMTICNFSMNLIGDLDGKLKLGFTRTKDEDSSKRAKYKVSLGVVPDYLYDGEGMRIEGVKENRPAANAGIKDGDVVVSIGEIEIKDMRSYMQGLSSLEEGKIEKVKVKRGEKVLEFDVQF